MTYKYVCVEGEKGQLGYHIDVTELREEGGILYVLTEGQDEDGTYVDVTAYNVWSSYETQIRE